MGLPRRSFWDTGQIAFLRQHASLGAVELARLTGRSVASVKHAAAQARISLRRPGVRCGLVLGQPRGVALVGRLREDLVTRRVDPDVLARRMQLDAEAALCPRCGLWPARVRSTGLCIPCHKATFTEKHLEALDVLKAQRELNRAKQAHKRLRDRVREDGTG